MSDHPVILVSLDPGTKCLGVCVAELTAENTYRPIEVYTVEVLAEATRRHPELFDHHGRINAQYHVINETIRNLLIQWQPVGVVTEGPYFRRFPTPYRVLVECVLTIRRAVSEYDPYMQLQVIQPNVVKESVGVHGTSGDKELMRAALSRGVKGLDLSNIMLEQLDEHAIDAIAVGYCAAAARVTA